MTSTPAKPILAPDQSAALRDRLVAELGALQSADEAAGWAHRSLPAKNTLTAADAELVAAGFRIKLASGSSSRHLAMGRPVTGCRPSKARLGRNRTIQISK